jgi:hypothetical protein
MMKPKMNKQEQRLLEFFRANPGKRVHVGKVAEVLYKDKEPPKNWYGSTAATMRTFILKCQFMGLANVQRVSKLGPSRRAEYMMEEDHVESSF